MFVGYTISKLYNYIWFITEAVSKLQNFEARNEAELTKFLGSRFVKDKQMWSDLGNLNKMPITEYVSKKYEQELLDTYNFFKSQQKRGKLVMGQNYDAFLDNISIIQRALTLLNKYYKELFNAILDIRDKTRNLMLELGILAKPELKSLTIFCGGDNYGTYDAEGELSLNVELLSKQRPRAELTIVHEFAHSAQPLAKAHAATASSKKYEIVLEIAKQISAVVFETNTFIRDYNSNVNFLTKAYGIKLREAPVIPTTTSSNIMTDIRLGSYHGSEFEYIFSLMGAISKTLKLAYKMLSRSSPGSKWLLNELTKNQKNIAKSGKDLNKIWMTLSKQLPELIDFDPNKQIIEGFATLIEYFYGKKYNLEWTEYAIASTPYLPLVTRAYAIYLREPLALKGIFTGLSHGIKSWNAITNQLTELKNELANIKFSQKSA